MKCLITSILLFLGFTSYAENTQIYASAEENYVKILWMADSWGETQVGFNLKKRVADGSWVKLNSAPLKPELSETKDYSLFGLNHTQAAKVTEKFNILKLADQVGNMTTEEMLPLIQGKNNLRGSLSFLKDDFDMALIYSFGYIDNDFRDTDILEYGLFPVDETGQEGNLVSSTEVKYYPPNDPGFKVNAKFKRTEQVSISWTYSVEEYDKRSLKGFFIYRKQSDGEFKLLTDTAHTFSDPEVKEGMPPLTDHYWTFNDSEVDPIEEQTYAIIPCNFFQKEFPEMFEFKYVPSEHKSLSEVPEISLNNISPRNLEVNWKLKDEDEANLVKNFSLKVTDTEAEVTTVLAENLDKSLRKFVDTTVKTEGKIYTYTLTTVDNNDIEGEIVENIYYLDVLIPPMVTGLKGVANKVDDNIQVSLSWDAKAEDDDITSVYRIYHDFVDEGEMLEQAEIGDVEGNSYNIIYPSNLGREVSFGVVPISTTGDRNEMTVIKVFIPYIELPFPPTCTTQLTNDNKIKIDWTYPVITELKGFRIYSGETLIVDEKTLNKDTKTFLYDPGVITEDAYFEFSVSAVGMLSESDTKTANDVFIKKPITGYKPENLNVTVVNNKLNISWKEIDLDEKDLNGFWVMIDQEAAGKFTNVTNKLFKEFSYTWDLPQSPRTSYTVKILPIKKDQEFGPETSVNVTP